MGALLWIVFAAIAIYFGTSAEKARRRRMEELARSMHLTWHAAGFGGVSHIDGTLEGFRVTVAFHGGRTPYTQFDLEGVRPGISFGRESWLFRGNLDVQTGDAAFDRKVRLEGGEAELLALLDAETRALVLELVQEGGTVADGRIRLRRSGTYTTNFDLTLERMTRLAKKLSVPRPDVARLLAHRARVADVPGVRRRALQVLLARFRDRDETRETCEALLRDRDPALRLMSAQALGNAGLAALEEILSDKSVPEDVRAEALDHLSRRGDPDAARRLLRAHLRDRDPAVRKAAIEAAGRLRDAESLPALLALPRRVDDDQKAAIAAALGRIGDPAAEEGLIQLLSESTGVRVEAANALARVGSARAVEALGSIAVGGLFAGEASRAATEAIHAIQSRLEGAGKGQLTIAEGGADGALSIADRRGAVSIVKKTS